MALSSVPASAPSLAAGHTNGQLTMNDASPDSKSDRLASSFSVESAGPPRPLSAISWMMLAAERPASVSSPSFTSSAGASGFSRMCPPALSTSALIHTVSDSARMP